MLSYFAAFADDVAELPECDSLAAAFGDNSDSVSRSASAARPAHHPEETVPNDHTKAPIRLATIPLTLVRDERLEKGTRDAKAHRLDARENG
jgi:hypothetical protein